MFKEEENECYKTPFDIDKIYVENRLLSKTRIRFVTHPDVGEGNIKIFKIKLNKILNKFKFKEYIMKISEAEQKYKFFKK
jgi:hypothetical protein